jgi:dihydroorotate dehydrogenase
VASGGIGSAEDARRLLDAGSDLVQLWTGMIYAGPGLIGEVVFASFEA